MIPTDGIETKTCQCGNEVEPEIREDPPDGFKIWWNCDCDPVTGLQKSRKFE